MDKVTQVKREIAASQWAEIISECRNSGVKVGTWCSENGINIKTYYYHLQRLREKLCEQVPVSVASVPVLPRQHDSVMCQTATVVTVQDTSGLTVGISDGTSAETISAVIRALKC